MLCLFVQHFVGRRARKKNLLVAGLWVPMDFCFSRIWTWENKILRVVEKHSSDQKSRSLFSRNETKWWWYYNSDTVTWNCLYGTYMIINEHIGNNIISVNNYDWKHFISYLFIFIFPFQRIRPVSNDYYIGFTNHSHST